MKVPEKYYDEIFHFAGLWDVPPACGLKTVNKKIVIVTELYRDNPGTSVTQAGKLLAQQICERKGLSLSEIMYIECNPDTNSVLSFYDEQYFEVTFSQTAPNTCRKLSKDEIQCVFSCD